MKDENALYLVQVQENLKQESMMVKAWNYDEMGLGKMVHREALLW